MGLALGAIGAVAGIAGAAASIMGATTAAEAAQEQGQAQSQMYQYQAQIARNNAVIQEQNAEVASRAGETQAFNVGLKESEQIGETKATMGARGVDVNSGSNASVLSAEHQIAATDIGTVRSNAAQQIYGYKVQAASDTAQAGLDTMGAQQSLIAGQYGSTSALLSGVSSLGANWNKFQLGADFNTLGSTFGSMFNGVG